MSSSATARLNPFAARGVTSIELALALAVTAVLGGLGFSAYRTHVVRSEIARGVAVADAARREVETAFERDSEPPPDGRSVGLASVSSDYVESLEIVDGRIDLRFGAAASPAIAGRTLSLTPFETATQEIVWVCGNRIPGPGLQPLGFANGARQAVQVITQIEPRYLPPNCR
jgi:type IV pilus assembly protein PilA